ncbi:hypothetical protein [Promicromonospora iranensis]|uniref:hypothetical protein n=1 Tax=Promicromonospora iranensis TaxID=1105144 RepID=UPI0023AA0C8A|nr:hypothetical protein [Promicromonospora iranensis]
MTTANRRSEALWLDDPEGGDGPTPETSHPAFARVAPPQFYDKGDEFAPFGNDAGSDMLGSVQDWYRAGMTDDELPHIVISSLGDWDTEGITDGLWSGESDVVDDWFAAWGGSDAAHHVYHETNRIIAAAIAQFKVRGALDPIMLRTGLYALAVKRGELDDAEVRYPRWTHAADAWAGLEAARRVLIVAPVRDPRSEGSGPGPAEAQTGTGSS